MATYKLLDSYTVGAGGASSVTFSNIPQTYTDLLVKYTQRNNASNNYNPVLVQFNSTTTGSNVELYGNGSSASAGTNAKAYVGYVNGNNTTANTFSNVEFYIPNYTSTNKKSISIDSVTENNGTTALADLAATLQDLTSPITSMTFTIDAAANFAQYGTFYLYGVWADSSTGTPSAPTIGTATATSDSTATVAFTPAGTGSTASAFQATSTPGSITAIGTSSPITVTGLTGSTSYTFKVAGINPIGTGLESSASNQITTSASPGYVAIATANASGSSTIHFNAIPQTYKHLILRFSLSFSGGGDSSFRFYLNGDTGNNYFWHDIYFDGSPHNYYTGNTDNIFITNHYQGNSNYPSAGYLDIMNYTSGQKKSVRVMAGTGTANADGGSIGSGLWNSTSAITSISLLCKGSYVFANGKVGLFGIK